jgi:hypothetical protein
MAPAHATSGRTAFGLGPALLGPTFRSGGGTCPDPIGTPPWRGKLAATSAHADPSARSGQALKVGSTIFGCAQADRAKINPAARMRNVSVLRNLMATSSGSRGLRKIDGGIIPKKDKRGVNPYVARTPVFGARGSSLAKAAHRKDRRLPSGWGVGPGKSRRPQRRRSVLCLLLLRSQGQRKLSRLAEGAPTQRSALQAKAISVRKTRTGQGRDAWTRDVARLTRAHP